jgi:hypothetical protein
MSSKKPCINYPSCTYTGKEQSPLRFGLSAEGYSVNSVIEGYDKNLWVVEIKNNKKVWVKREENFAITPEEPVIKCTESSLPVDTSSSVHDVVTTLPQIAEKKTTDYNLYLSYRLSQLKQTNPDNDNKTNFASVIKEWKVIKNIPEDLKKIIEDAKQFALSRPVKAPSNKKPTKAKDTSNIPDTVSMDPETTSADAEIPVATEPSDVKIKTSKRKVTKK